MGYVRLLESSLQIALVGYTLLVQQLPEGSSQEHQEVMFLFRRAAQYAFFLTAQDFFE
jgi:hypothetical protein